MANELPLRWEDRAEALLRDLKIAAITYGAITYRGSTHGEIYVWPAVEQILNAPPNTSYIRHALRERIQQAGIVHLTQVVPGPPEGPGYRPLQLECLVEAYAREEGSHSVAERHIAKLFKEGWSQQLAALGIDAGALEEYVRRMELGPDWFRDLIASSWHGLLDANIIIQGKDLSNILWLKETGKKKVTLWISSTLLEELDRLKFHHNSSRVKKRATRFGRWLAPQMDTAMKEPGITIRRNVVLRVWVVEGKRTAGHDTDHLETAVMMRDHGIPVVLVTQDLGLQARATAARVPVLSLSEQSMLPPQGDAPEERDKEDTMASREDNLRLIRDNLHSFSGLAKELEEYSDFTLENLAHALKEGQRIIEEAKGNQERQRSTGQ